MPYGKCSFFKTFYLIFYKSQLSNSSIKTLDKSILLQIFLQAFVVCRFTLIFSINLLSQTMLDLGFGNDGKVFASIGNSLCGGWWNVAAIILLATSVTALCGLIFHHPLITLSLGVQLLVLVIVGIAFMFSSCRQSFLQNH